VRFVVFLAVAYVAAATLVVFVLSQLAPYLVQVVPQQWLLRATIVACLVGLVVDTRAIRRRGLSVGLSRQTPKTLLRLGEHAWITPLVWGFDTGLVWTTYRVSFCSWLLLLMASAGFAPPWAGAVCGLSFAGPLLAAVLLRKYHLPRRTIMSSPIPAQLFGVGSMGLVGVVASIATVGHV
jgi:hypothetical protein